MKNVGLIFVVLLFCTTSFAQFRQNGNPPKQSNSNDQNGLQNKFYFGIGGGLGFGTGYNYYSILPIIAYRATPQFSVGTGITYQRYNYTYTTGSTQSFTQYGITPFLRYNVNNVFFQSEFDYINAPSYNYNGDLIRSYYSRLLFGIGYIVPLGERGAFNAVVMYDVLYKTPSVFGSPVVARVFFTF